MILRAVAHHTLKILLGRRDRTLNDNDARFRLAFENANIGNCLIDLQGRLIRVNKEMCEISGYSQAELEAREGNDTAHSDYTGLSPTFIRESQSGGAEHTTFEKVYVHKDGHPIHGCVSGSLLRDSTGPPLGFIAQVLDITHRKQSEQELQLAASVFAHAREEVLGHNSRLLASGKQDAKFYEAMWSAVKSQGHWSGEIWNRRKNGEIYPEFLTVSSITDDRGAVQQYLALFSDITLRKSQEDKVRQLAFYDPLTRLPNRRLLGDRLSQALESSTRSLQYGAVMFMDLDNFKSLNDQHGHSAGDND